MIAIGLFFAWLPVSMALVNLMGAALRPARRTLHEGARDVLEADLVSANRRLLKALAVMTPAGLLAALVGVAVLIASNPVR